MILEVRGFHIDLTKIVYIRFLPGSFDHEETVVVFDGGDSITMDRAGGEYLLWYWREDNLKRDGKPRAT